MTDKEKIRAEVERMHNLLPVMDGDNISVNYADRICTTLEMYIDSMQEEPVSEDLDVAAFDYAETCKYEGGEKLLCVEHFKAGAEWSKKHQAEKDLELTWEDMMLIHKCIKDAMNYHLYKMIEGAEGQMVVYQEVLKRFKNLKK